MSGSFSSGISRSALSERFKAFNTMFEVVHRTQSTWSVPGAQLRDELRISLSENLILAYKSFLGRFSGHIESGRDPENYLSIRLKISRESFLISLKDIHTSHPSNLRRR